MGLIDFVRDAGENILGKVGDLFGGGESAEKKATGVLGKRGCGEGFRALTAPRHTTRDRSR